MTVAQEQTHEVRTRMHALVVEIQRVDDGLRQRDTDFLALAKQPQDL